MSQIKVRQVVTYGGHNLQSSGSVNLTLKAKYGELVNTIQLMQMLNNNISIKAKTQNGKPMSLGEFMIKNISVSSDGESTIKFNSTDDFVNLNNLNSLPLRNEEMTEFVVLMEAEIEEEE